jgi:hypothetical protein
MDVRFFTTAHSVAEELMDVFVQAEVMPGFKKFDITIGYV